MAKALADFNRNACGNNSGQSATDGRHSNRSGTSRRLKAGFLGSSAQISVQKYCAFDARKHAMTTAPVKNRWPQFAQVIGASCWGAFAVGSLQHVVEALMPLVVAGSEMTLL
jgi:hypothetical protein